MVQSVKKVKSPTKPSIRVVPTYGFGARYCVSKGVNPDNSERLLVTLRLELSRANL